MSLGSFFTKKIGPLPVWGYGAIAAGGTFILLKGGGAGGKKGKKSPSGSANNAPDGTSTGSFTSSMNETLSDNQTFGGGTLGFLGWPVQAGRNIFVHLHPHPFGGFFHGGHQYSSHAFRGHGFGRDGIHRGGYPGSDHRHGFAGGRDFHGRNNGGGHPRGFGQGHYNPRAGIGAGLAKFYHPGNKGARRIAPNHRGVNPDALPSNR